jgi:indole-3-glycerol phosphate synthase
MADLTGTFLGEIIAARKESLAIARACIPRNVVQSAAEARAERRDFEAALEGTTLRVIAEMKRASPSRGLLRHQYRRQEIARAYESAGAAALSVLTEEQHFLGSLDDLSRAREAVQLPVLRKDFIVDDYQVYESVAAGADALLLIVAALDDGDLRNLLELATCSRIAALVEVHTEEELDRALDAGARILGVNNRDLKTLEVNLETSLRLRSRIPSTCLAVSESGIQTPVDVQRLGEAGFDAILIGERLMAAPEPGKALAELLESFRATVFKGAIGI